MQGITFRGGGVNSFFSRREGGKKECAKPLHSSLNWLYEEEEEGEGGRGRASNKGGEVFRHTAGNEVNDNEGMEEENSKAGREA